MFDFDRFVNVPAMRIFGRKIIYRPKNNAVASFAITGDFHESFMDINLKNADANISTAKIVLFVRIARFPTNYPAPLAGDYVEVRKMIYQIVNVELDIPGIKKLILHEE